MFWIIVILIVIVVVIVQEDSAKWASREDDRKRSKAKTEQVIRELNAEAAELRSQIRLSAQIAEMEEQLKLLSDDGVKIRPKPAAVSEGELLTTPGPKLISTPLEILTANQQRIKEQVKQRAIVALTHFTAAKNLINILQDGLISRAELDAQGVDYVYNDSMRLDGVRNATSLSISFPNYKMFYKYRNLNLSREWVVLLIDPSVLWEMECMFCRYNAADSRISRMPKDQLTGVEAFNVMFDPIEQGVQRPVFLKEADPFDVQAEVLVSGIIPAEKILMVACNSHHTFRKITHAFPNVNCILDFTLFQQRRYAREAELRRGA